MKRKEVCPEFHRRRPFEDAAPLRRIVLRLRFPPETITMCRLFRNHILLLEMAILERSENLGQILTNVLGEHEAKGGMPRISSSKAFRRRCASTSNSSPP